MFRARVVAVVAMLAVLGAACGGAGDDGDEQAFCEVASQLTDRNPLAVLGSGTPEEVKAAMEDLTTLLADARKSAPSGVRADVVTIADALDSVIDALAAHDYDVSAASQDISESALAKPETQAALSTAGDNLRTFATDTCGLGSTSTSEAEPTTTVPAND